jgi:hypothetical protein
MRNLRSAASVALVIAGGVEREDGVGFTIVGGRHRGDRVILGIMRGRGGSRPGPPITGGPDVKNRPVLAIVGGLLRDSRVRLVVNAHISA